ncbi:hypothetical protein KC345_g11059, partial [Hortaea werneckii]
QDSRLEYAEAEQLGLAALNAAAAGLVNLTDPDAEAAGLASPVTLDAAAAVPDTMADTPLDKEFTLFNSSLFEGSRLAAVPHGAENTAWTDAAGNPLSAQRSGGQWLVEVEAVPAMGSAVICAAHRAVSGENPKQPVPFAWKDSTLTTPYYILEWNAAGQLSRIFDRRESREVLAPGECGNMLQVFEDKPKMYDAWDIDLYYQEKMRVIDDLRSVELTECGPLQAVLEFTWKYMDSSIIQKVKVYAGSARIDFETLADWHEQHQLLKAAFPVAVRATEATYDIQFGNVKRPTHWNTSWDYARFESVGHQWADLSERGYGVSLLNDCKYGYDIKDHTMRLSLIKSATSPDRLADQGEHRFTYALLPHKGDWAAAGTVQEAWALNNPLLAAIGSYTAGNGKSLITCDAPNIAVDAVKLAEDGSGCIVRLHEYTGTRCTANVGSDYSAVSWQQRDLMERPLETEAVDGPAIRLEFKPLWREANRTVE